MPWDERTRSRLKLRDLDILIAVIDTGSMGKAARRLNVFQPSISKSIADLERTLGVRLLDRNRRGVEPTPYGLALVKRGGAAFDELRQAVQEIEFLADPTAGELRVGGSDPMVGGLIPVIIDRISRKYPRVVFRVIHGSSDRQLFQALRDRDADLVVTRLPRVIEGDDLRAEVLFDEPLVIACGTKNPWARRRQIDLAELVGEPWVLPRPETWVGSMVADGFRAAGFEPPRNVVYCNSMQMNHALLATGRYLAHFSGSFLRISAKRLAIKILPVKFPIRSSSVGIVSLNNRMLSPIAQVFAAQARDIGKLFEKGGALRTSRHV